ncbi:MAG TPA: hypothetical protein VE378_04610 [Nitrososphaeraceae archaeon]|nr:hypothetical protein [Nitrososphaeraceae archaeon]
MHCVERKKVELTELEMKKEASAKAAAEIVAEGGKGGEEGEGKERETHDGRMY